MTAILNVVRQNLRIVLLCIPLMDKDARLDSGVVMCFLLLLLSLLLLFFYFVNLTQANVIQKEGISNKKMSPTDSVGGKPVGHFLN